MNIPKTTVGTIDLIAIKNWKKNRVYLTDFLNFVEQNIHKVVCFPLTKLRFVLSNDDQCKKQELISLLKHSGYEYEHTFKRECGSCDITFFSKLISHISTGE